MLLTLSQPSNNEFGGRPPHDYSPPQPYSSASHYRSSPKTNHFDRPPGALPGTNHYSMSTSHRGLPPPSAMTLPDPARPPPSLPSQQPLGPMPAPPNQWQGAEESMRNWLSTKAEEERRKQEEEKTRQETLRLEQRRVEQSMLRESMQGGVPPQMIPMIFAGLGGSNLAHASLEWLQQYAAQLQASQQQLQNLEVSSDGRREARLINPPQPPYAPGAQVQPPPPPPPPPLAQHTNTFPAFPSDNRGAQPAPTSAPRSTASSGLSRLNTVDLAPQSNTAPSSSHPRQQQQQQQQDQPNSSPSIYFHHWVPPAPQESKGTQPPTPSGRNEPGSAHPSHVGENEYKDSPRKRKATGGHQATPAPSQTSPSFSSQSSRGGSKPHSGHMRSRSNKSTEDSSEASRRDSVAAPRVPHEGGREITSSRPSTQSGYPTTEMR